MEVSHGSTRSLDESQQIKLQAEHNVRRLGNLENLNTDSKNRHVFLQLCPCKNTVVRHPTTPEQLLRNGDPI
jgi:hypothetical protein